MASKIRIAITTGDIDGIGWEVTCKALNALGPRPGTQFVVYRHPRCQKPALNRKFKVSVVASASRAAEETFDPRTLIEIRSAAPPAFWVEEAADFCARGAFQGLVTAPLSKTSIIEAGLKDIGHTEILARVTKKSKLFMGFIGRKFNVLLATGHRPLREAIEQLSLETLRDAVAAAREMREALPTRRQSLPIALVGVNPHAGEGGLLGHEEGVFKGWIESSGLSSSIEGPLVPDSAFLAKNWPNYSLYICSYHDQGLIPFKMAHGFQSGVHLTLGLPFVRTSVDHGTAKELFGKNRAEFGSMKEALLTAIRLCKTRVV